MDLGTLADSYIRASAEEKKNLEAAIIDSIDSLLAESSGKDTDPDRFIRQMDSLFDREPLSDAILSKGIEALGRKGYINYLEGLGQRNDLGHDSIETLAAIAADNGQFHSLSDLLERASPDLRKRLGYHAFRGLETMAKAWEEKDWETIVKMGDPLNNQNSVCSILRVPSRLALSDEALANLLTKLETAGFFGFADVFGFPDFYELAGLHVRIASDDSRQVVEKLFLGSVKAFLDRFDGISSDQARSLALPYDDEPRLSVLNNKEGLSPPMREQCEHLLWLMKVYEPYRDEKTMRPPASASTDPKPKKIRT